MISLLMTLEDWQSLYMKGLIGTLIVDTDSIQP